MLSSVIFAEYCNAQTTGADTAQYKLYIFTGSDWCAVCRKMDAKLFRDSSIIHALDSQSIKLIIVDFPQRTKQTDSVKQHNAVLSEQFSFTGRFPTLILTGKDDKKFISLFYNNEAPAEFIQLIRNRKKELYE